VVGRKIASAKMSFFRETGNVTHLAKTDFAHETKIRIL
jgi:hypothetical protein